MKSIKLTEEHRSKLLEMCRKLFSEYNFRLNENVIVISEKKEISFDTHTTYRFLDMNFETMWDLFKIHWFEFCTKIAYKMFSGKQAWYQKDEFIIFMKTMCMQDKGCSIQHPIDYLYQEFKKLKL